MTESSMPYFFDEATRASIADEPGEREKAQNLSQDDLAWLQTVYLPTQAERIASKHTMQVDQLQLDLADSSVIALAGAFAMSRPATDEVTLYTPWKGLLKYADMDAAKAALKQWLTQEDGKRELLRYLSVKQRGSVLASKALKISIQAIEDKVFEHQEQILTRNRTDNFRAMLAELIQTPTLQSMLDDILTSALFKPFPGLDQRQTRVDSYNATLAADAINQTRRLVSSVPLSDALLQFYLSKRWPPGDSRVFSNPAQGTASKADNQAWEACFDEIVRSFTPRLESLLETFWNTSISQGPTRRDFFLQCMTDAYHLDLLLKRQQGILTTEQYLRLSKVSLESSRDTTLRVEKVRITALFKHYVELASTLMIGDRDTLGCLYSPSRGIEVTSDLAAIRAIVLQMLKSEGHEDNLLNFLSLEQRRRFLQLEPDERLVVGAPVPGPVFEHLLDDILLTQRDNLTFALNRYCESEGALDPHALIDKALDVRGLIDERLLAVDVDGRWSTDVDHRWNAQPATVRAESAKEQLALLTSVEQALEQRLASVPAITHSTSSVAEAQRSIESFLPQLQADYAHLFSTALRSELKLRGVAHTLGATEQAIIKTVLDAPVKLQRPALNGFLPDAFTLALKVADSADPLKLASCFVLTERGGLDREHSGKCILWTPALGFEAFASLSPLLGELERRLKAPDERRSLLENLGPGERLPGRSYTLAPLQRVLEHVFDQLQKPFVKLDETAVALALKTQPRPDTLNRLLELVALRKPHTGLRRATNIAQSLTTQEKLPAWLAKASVADQILHAELLAQYVNHVKDDKDCLSDIQSLPRTAHAALVKQLEADSFDVDPDKIQVHLSARRTAAASTLTLTQLALNHLQDLDDAHFTLASLDEQQIPAAMNESYVKRLIRQLNPGQLHQAIIKAGLAATDADAVQRRQRFARQVPWQLLHYAHGEKLQERLSQRGFDLIKQIIDMPDPIARAAVEGADAIIAPLELKGIKDAQTLQVPGVYRLYAKGKASGLQVLIAPYSPEHGVREYANETALLTALQTDSALRDWVLNSVPATDRALCKRRLSQTDSQAAPLGLASSPLQGNVLVQLFKDNANLLARLLGLQADSNAQDEWATIKQVLGEDLQQASSFFMGKLTYPLTVWRSFRSLKQSAEDLQTHKWKAALTGFIAGIAQIASLHSSAQTQEQLSSVLSSAQKGLAAADTPVKWPDIRVTAALRTRLEHHVASDIDLGALTLDPALGLYTHPTTQNHYAPVEGKVYPVKQAGKRWHIVGEQTQGPYLRQIQSTFWSPDLKSPPRLGVLNRWNSAFSAWSGMNIEASGMPDIQRLFPVKARLIEEGLDQATDYLWTAWRNLKLLTPGSKISPVHRIVMDCLDVPTVEPAYVTAIEKVVDQLFAALLDPKLRSPKSNRFAVGRLRSDADNTFGFIVPGDKQRKIYLAEKFFLPDFDFYRNYLSAPAFPIRAHARAATLIHELSHVINGTEDMAYLDTGRPFEDLIQPSTLVAANLKNALSELRNYGFSSRTPLSELFARFNGDTGVWEDLGSTSYEDTDQAYRLVLKLTGKKTLNEARAVFKADAKTRLAVLLGNADTVTWLIMQLGRQLHAATP
jgi:hypothetical protein